MGAFNTPMSALTYNQRIMVMTNWGQRIDIDSAETVGEMKLKIKALCGFDPSRQFIKYALLEEPYKHDTEKLKIKCGDYVTLFILSEHTNNSFLLGQPRTQADHCLYMLPYRAPIKLFCFPCLGGSASSQFGEWRSLWSDVLGTVGETVQAEYPGHGADRSPLVNDMTVLAQHLVTSLDLDSITEPFALLGHSMGAIVAYEVAKLLEKQGRKPVALFAVAQMSPSSMFPDWELDVSDTDFVASLVKMGGIDKSILGDKETVDYVLKLCRNDNLMEHKYVKSISQSKGCTEGSIKCPVFPTVFTQDAPCRDLMALEEWAAVSRIAELGATHEIQGDHFAH